VFALWAVTVLRASPFVLSMHLRILVLTIPSALLVVSALAQEAVPLDEAQRGARIVTDALGTVSDAPFKLEVDVSKPQAIKAGRVGLMVIPGKDFTSASLEKIGSDIIPLGQLWTLNVSLGKEGQATPKEDLRFLTVSEGDRTENVQLYYLGVSKNSEGKLDLTVFAKGSEPLLKLPLTKGLSSEPSQLFPIEITGKKEDDNTGILSLDIIGGYHVDLTVKRPAE
jgi:hypothetical protein